MSTEAKEKKDKKEKELTPLEETIQDVTKTFGEGSIFQLDNSKQAIQAPHIPTDLFELDNYVLGIGGIPQGRIIEIYGPESSGKTSFALSLIGNAQKTVKEKKCAIIDAEHALDPAWAKKLGVDVSQLFISQPDDGESCLQIAEKLIRSGEFSVVVVDSVAALVPKAELAGEIGESHMGLQARLMGQALRMLNGAISKTDTILVFINQLRMKIGVMFGNPETTSGGRALPFYASIRLDIRVAERIKNGETIIGNRVKIKCVKNKMSPPFRDCVVDFYYDRGFDKIGSLFDAGVANGIITVSGSWFDIDGDKLGQGKEKSCLKLNSDPALLTKLTSKLKE